MHEGGGLHAYAASNIATSVCWRHVECQARIATQSSHTTSVLHVVSLLCLRSDCVLDPPAHISVHRATQQQHRQQLA